MLRMGVDMSGGRLHSSGGLFFKPPLPMNHKRPVSVTSMKSVIEGSSVLGSWQPTLLNESNAKLRLVRSVLNKDYSVFPSRS